MVACACDAAGGARRGAGGCAPFSSFENAASFAPSRLVRLGRAACQRSRIDVERRARAGSSTSRAAPQPPPHMHTLRHLAHRLDPRPTRIRVARDRNGTCGARRALFRRRIAHGGGWVVRTNSKRPRSVRHDLGAHTTFTKSRAPVRELGHSRGDSGLTRRSPSPERHRLGNWAFHGIFE